jgi:hypothetical protein
VDGTRRRKIHEMFPAHLSCHDIVKTSDGREIWRQVEKYQEGPNKKKRQEYSVCSSHRIVKRLKEVQDDDGGEQDINGTRRSNNLVREG